MKKNIASFTAQGIAFIRALESRKPEEERICYDPYAEKFFGGIVSLFDRLYSRLMRWFGPGWVYERFEKKGAGVSGFIVARTRFIDDYLSKCINEGIEQLVILGAGYDSRAYRFDKLNNKVSVFEVDHPATQEAKKEVLTTVFGSLPDYVGYVPVDFNEQTLEQRLYEYGYKDDCKTLFIWEGVTTYLVPEAVDSTLAFVVKHSGIGSSIIFDYVYPCAIDGRCKRKEISRMQKFRSISGEAPVFGLDPDKMEAFLGKRGFNHITNVNSEDLKRMYFNGVNANRQVAPVYGIVHATVKPK